MIEKITIDVRTIDQVKYEVLIMMLDDSGVPYRIT